MQYDPLSHIILRTEVGSTAHGTGLDGHEDLDHMAICVETDAQTLGLEVFEHLIHRPGRGPNDSSGPGDLDLTIYGLRKWARLVLKGNPSVLMLLFGPIVQQHPLAAPLFDLRSSFINQHTQSAFLGYMQQQRLRMTGERGRAGRLRHNPDSKDDVDWKYAMHMLRLSYQGYEYLTTGHISLPIQEPMRDLLRLVRQGRIPLRDVIAASKHYEILLKDLDLSNDLPFDRLQSVIIDIHKKYWELQTL